MPDPSQEQPYANRQQARQPERPAAQRQASAPARAKTYPIKTQAAVAPLMRVALDLKVDGRR